MTPQDIKLDKLKSLLELVNKDYVSNEEFSKSIMALIEVVKKSKANTEGEKQQFIQFCTEQLAEIKDQNNRSWKDIASKIESIKDGADGKDYILTYKDKQDISALIQVPIVEKTIEKTEVIKEKVVKDTKEQIRDKLELLKDEERLDASAIKNLPKAFETKIIERGGGNSPMVYHDDTLSGSGTQSEPLKVIGGTGGTGGAFVKLDQTIPDTTVGTFTFPIVNVTDNYTIRGLNALRANGTENIFVGQSAGNGTLTTAYYNTAIGSHALTALTTGQYNAALGGYALSANKTGSFNTAFGNGALFANVDDTYNTAIGSGAMSNSNTNNYNTVVGGASGVALGGSVTHGNNVMVGYNTAPSMVAVSNNTIIGTQAGYTSTAGSGNVFLGYRAGFYETGSNTLFIDNTTRASEADARSTALMYGIFDSAIANQRLTVNAYTTVNGYFGIGVGTPTSPFHLINGSSGTITMGTDSSFNINTGTSGGLFNITSAGNLIANTTDPAGNYDFAGGNTGNASMGVDYKLKNYDGYFQSPWFAYGDYVNYLLYSETFSNAAWVKTAIGTVTVDSAYSPNGGLTAEQIPAGSGATGALSQDITNSTTGSWTFSVYLKAQSGTATIQLQCNSSGGAGGETGTAKNINLTTTWKRYYVTQNYTTGHTTKTVKIISGTNAICAWGAQFEPSATLRAYTRATTSVGVTTLVKEFSINSGVIFKTADNLFQVNTAGAITTVQGIACIGTISSYTSSYARANQGFSGSNSLTASATFPTAWSPFMRLRGFAYVGSSKDVGMEMICIPNALTTAVGNLSLRNVWVDGTLAYANASAFGSDGTILAGGMNAQGQGAMIEAANPASVGGELITNEAFTTDTTGWTGTNATLATDASGQSGNCLKITNSSAASGYAYQTITTVVGTRYFLSFYYKDGTSSGAHVKVGTSVGGGELFYMGRLTGGAWSTPTNIDFVATSTSTTISFQNSSASNGVTSFIDGVTMKACTGGDIMARGALKSSATGDSYIGGSVTIGATTAPTQTATVVGTIGATDNIIMNTAAKGLVLKRGSNGKCGTFVANGATPVTVSNTSVAITDTIVFSLNTVGGTVGLYPVIQTITASTGFTVACTATDTSTYNYIIISNAA